MFRGMNRANTLAELDSFAKSITTLLQLLTDTGINLPSPGINHQAQINRVTHLLDAFAHTLVRFPGERLAVGLTADYKRLSAYHHLSPEIEQTEWFCEDAKLEQALSHNLVAAKKSVSPKAPSNGEPDPHQNYSSLVERCTNAEQLVLHIWQYRSLVGPGYDRLCSCKNSLLTSNSRKESCFPHLPFKHYARSVFLLLRSFLKDQPDQQADARQMFYLYIVGMSLPKLLSRLEEPLFKSRTRRHQRMHDFLNEPLESDHFSLKEDAWSKSEHEDIYETLNDSLDVAVKLASMEGEEEELRSLALKATSGRRLDKFVARIFHFMLRTFVNTIEKHANEFQDFIDTPSSNPSQDPRVKKVELLNSIVYHLILLNCCVTDLHQIMEYHIRGVRLPDPFTPSTPAQSSEDLVTLQTSSKEPNVIDNTADEETTNPSIVEAYKRWLQGIVRLTRCAMVLTEEKPWKRRVLAMDLDLITEQRTDTDMQSWEDAVRDAFSIQNADGSPTEILKCERIVAALSSFAVGNLKKTDNQFDHLRSENWKFAGTRHCESIIAANSPLGVDGKVRYRISPSGYRLTVGRLRLCCS